MDLNDPAILTRVPDAQETAAVDAAIATRRSIRAFLPDPVPREVIADILRVAARAPSGTNTQPWKVYVLTGAKLRSVCDAVCALHDNPAARADLREEYDYYPTEWKAPFIDRRRKVGWDLYGLLGIGKADKDRMHRQHGRNFRFFDAPVGMFFTIDRIMGQGSWLDYGMFLQNVMTAARARGLHTCPQAAWTLYHATITDQLDAPANEMLVCGLALGHADPQAVENALVTEREPVEGFTSFLD